MHKSCYKSCIQVFCVFCFISSTGAWAQVGAPNTRPATTRTQAQTQAKSLAGRSDPFSPLHEVKAFPHNNVERKTSKLPPPPLKTVERLGLEVPPPPPGTFAAPVQNNQSLSLSELPSPPEKPTIAEKLKLVGIVGNEAIFNFSDIQFRLAHKYPETLVLKPGDRFETVNLVSVEKESVVLDEDGARCQKTLPLIGK
jgi:hypothetical protein